MRRSPPHITHKPRQVDCGIRFADGSTTTIVPSIDNVTYMGSLNIPIWSVPATPSPRQFYYAAALWLSQGQVLRFQLDTTIQVISGTVAMHSARYQGSTAVGFSVRSLPGTPYACTADLNMFANAGASVTAPYNSGGYADGVYTAEATGAYQFNYCE